MSEEEICRMRLKMEELGIRSQSAYLRKMALDGYSVKLDLQARFDEIWGVGKEILLRLSSIQ